MVAPVPIKVLATVPPVKEEKAVKWCLRKVLHVRRNRGWMNGLLHDRWSGMG